MQSTQITTLDGAKFFVQQNREEGVVCPCCEQFAKIYRRSITSSMARALIKIYRAAGENVFVSVYIPDVLNERESADFAKLRYWGLIAAVHGNRGDGSRRNGYWKVTFAGKKFVMGERQVRKYVHIYNGEALEFDGKHIDIDEALGNKFNYDELMAGV